MTRTANLLLIAPLGFLLVAVGCSGSGSGSTGKGGSTGTGTGGAGNAAGGHAGTVASGGTTGAAGSGALAGQSGAAGRAGASGAAGGAGAAGSGQTGAGGSVACFVVGVACTTNAQCCSQSCDTSTGTCASRVTTCGGTGASCTANTDCCNLQCDTSRGICSTATSCTADNAACTASASCCSGNCASNKCQPLNTTCKTAGNPCTAAADGGAGGCCSGLCKNGTCSLNSSFCIQPGDVCSRDVDCCGAYCMKAAGATQGVCGNVSTTGTGSCTHDGVLCNGCGSCCSKNCGPWALTGVSVCQPGLGCKILNSLCTSNNECCGSSSGEVTCIPASGGDMSIGVCAQNHGNQVPGGICKLTGGANACSNAESDCTCAISPKANCCHYDTLGLPRCLGSGSCGDGGTGVFVGTDPKCCRAAGQTCNTSAECCNLAPCVPDATGTLRCYTPHPDGGTSNNDGGGTGGSPDGGIVCVPDGVGCTATGDCCTGHTCNFDGETWTCGPPSTPPPADAGVCALYGQGCNGGTPCCNGVQCTYSPTNSKCAGQTGCTCFTPP